MVDVTLVPGEVSTGIVALTANAVNTFTLQPDAVAATIMADGTADVWFTTNSTTPVVGGRGCYRIPAAGFGVRTTSIQTDGPSVLKLISSAAVVVTIEVGE